MKEKLNNEKRAWQANIVPAKVVSIQINYVACSVCVVDLSLYKKRQVCTNTLTDVSSWLLKQI